MGKRHNRYDYDYDEDDEDDSERLSLSDAADIWLSNGCDEDYTFGYTESQLRRAAGFRD